MSASFYMSVINLGVQDQLLSAQQVLPSTQQNTTDSKTADKTTDNKTADKTTDNTIDDWQLMNELNDKPGNPSDDKASDKPGNPSVVSNTHTPDFSDMSLEEIEALRARYDNRASVKALIGNKTEADFLKRMAYNLCNVIADRKKQMMDATVTPVVTPTVTPVTESCICTDNNKDLPKCPTHGYKSTKFSVDNNYKSLVSRLFIINQAGEMFIWSANDKKSAKYILDNIDLFHLGIFKDIIIEMLTNLESSDVKIYEKIKLVEFIELVYCMFSLNGYTLIKIDRKNDEDTWYFAESAKDSLPQLSYSVYKEFYMNCRIYIGYEKNKLRNVPIIINADEDSKNIVVFAVQDLLIMENKPYAGNYVADSYHNTYNDLE